MCFLFSASRITRRTHHEYSPEGIPGLVIEYKYEPGQEGHTGASADDCVEDIAPTVTIEGANIDGKDVMNWLEEHGFDWEKLEQEIIKAHE